MIKPPDFRAWLLHPKREEVLAWFELAAGDACIVAKGEWHLVKRLKPTQLVHITPGLHGDHRPL